MKPNPQEETALKFATKARLPTQPNKISAAIGSAHQAGPAAISRLIILCLWLVCQVNDPRASYPGPEGYLPFEYLLLVLEKQRDSSKPWFVTASFLSDIPRLFPNPQLSKKSRPIVEEEMARAFVEKALIAIANAPNPLNREYIYQHTLLDLWQRGLTENDLAPLLDMVLDQHNWESSAFPENTPELLFRIGKIKEGLEFLKSLKLNKNTNTIPFSNCARTLAEMGEHELARSILKDFCQSGSLLPNQGEYERGKIADVYAYLGDISEARSIAESINLQYRLEVESIITLCQYHNKSTVDLSKISELLERTTTLEPAKHRAAIQTGVLKILLLLKEYPSAWHCLKMIEDTLSATRAWGKLEFRTNDVASLLSEYVPEFNHEIYAFASSLLIPKAMALGHEKGDIWPVVHVISGLGWLIKAWAAPEDFVMLLDFLKYWTGSD